MNGTHFDGVDGAHADEEEIESERSHQAAYRRVADEQRSLARRIIGHCIRRLQQQHHHDQHHCGKILIHLKNYRNLTSAAK